MEGAAKIINFAVRDGTNSYRLSLNTNNFNWYFYVSHLAVYEQAETFLEGEGGHVGPLYLLCECLGHSVELHGLEFLDGWLTATNT